MAADRSFRTVVEMFHHRVAESGDADAMYGKRGDGWYTLSWRETGRQARRIACGLLALGLEKGTPCSILSISRPEWVITDMGILAAGGATTTIYPSNTAAESSYILNDSGSAVCFVENVAQAEKLLEVREEIPGVRKVILFDGEMPGDDWFTTFEAFQEMGEQWDSEHPGTYEQKSSDLAGSDLATLIYTSGTTGKPKGVMLTHDNWVYEGDAIAETGLLQPGDLQYLFLPLAHSFAKVLEIGFIRTGVPTAVEGSIDDLVENLGQIRPTTMGAVPRIFEKVYNKVIEGAKAGGGLKYKIFRWAVEVGSEVSRLRQKGQEPSGLLAVKHKLADKLVFSKLKDRFGGRIRFFISGGAPLSREIAEFFHAADILVLEGYGLTETSAATFVNRLDSYRFGTVGLPMPGTEVQIASEDGEILIRGRGVMKGYHNLPEATAETLDPDGWLHTGDVGVVDDDGFLAITDRKKDIIVTAGGKNVAPQNVENMLKAHTSYVSQVVMLGDKRPFCIALISINEETVGPWANEQGLQWSTYAELAALPQVKDLIWRQVEEVNSRLASYESIRKIHLIDHELSQETGELTPKMSIKRKVVEERHRDILEAMYSGTMADM